MLLEEVSPQNQINSECVCHNLQGRHMVLVAAQLNLPPSSFGGAP